MAVHLTGFGEPSVVIEVSLRWRPRQLDSSMHVNEGGQAVIGNMRSGTAGEGHHFEQDEQ